jgi:hypothetical protein
LPPFDRLAYREPRPSPAIIHVLGLLNRHLLLPHVLRIAAVDLPGEDLARLRSSVRPGTSAFVAPNHPEFMTDWMLDKEVSRRVSPLMAHWASYEVVNIHPVAQWLWLRNNLIANAPGGGGRAYSLRWARAGHGVLLHPEGAPSWRGDRVGPLVPGVVAMAWEACGADPPAPVVIVPLVWKLHFRGDVAAALEREIVHLERGLGLDARPGRGGAPLEQRFADLHEAVLAGSRERHGGGAVRGNAGSFFDRQAAHATHLIGALEARHGRVEGDLPRRLHGLRRAILASAAEDRKGARRDRRVLAEVERLHHFTRPDYGGPTLTQEQIAESLKQLRLVLLTRGPREALHGVVPVAVAPRIARIRAPQPLDVRAAYAAGGDPATAQASLLATLHTRLQDALDALNAAIAPQLAPFARPNPFAPS